MNIDTMARDAYEGAVIGLVHDLRFEGRSFAEILSEAGHRVVQGDLEAEATSADAFPQVVVMRIEAEDPACLDLIRALRSSPRARAVPILGVTTFDKMSLDLQELRSHGVVGLLDARSPAEQALQRIGQIVRPRGLRRSSERVRCFFPVDVAREGGQAREYALDLSVTGLRLTSEQALEENTDLQLRFSLPMVSDDTIETAARLVRRDSRRNSSGRYEVGVFFYPLEQRYVDVLRQEVERLLTNG
ncbi:MAG: PilZ domain-containing protein [Myxococcota bacterium]|nr:PilZ domain-containing protein [Myxococcota bacterium]